MIPNQTRFCGFCELPLELDVDAHACEERAWHEDYLDSLTHRPFRYSATAVAEGQQFLIDHPEFVDARTNPYTSHRSIGAYDTIEHLDFITPENYDITDLPVLSDGFPETDRSAEWDSIYALRDQYQRENLAYWKDVEPGRCTAAIYWWSNKRTAPGYPTAHKPNYVPNIKVRGQLTLFTLNEEYTQKYEGLDYDHANLLRLEFHELQGFASEILIDYGITERYQHSLFNVYVGRDEHLHCGLLKLDIPNKQVTCSRGDCYYRTHPLTIPDTDSRTLQEQFTHAIIRHGNNHGPDFYRKRKDFAFVHALNCDANHERSEHCNANRPVLQANTETLTGALNFLIHHRKFCTDSNCRCTAYYHSVSHRERELSHA